MKETGKLAKGKRKKKSSAPAKPSGTINSRIEKALRAWRLEEARRLGVPAFRILTDKVLRDIAIIHPATSDELLSISGIGMSTVEKYGPSIHRIVNERRG
jgi:superfamily II DNA helicase RecQ